MRSTFNNDYSLIRYQLFVIFLLFKLHSTFLVFNVRYPLSSNLHPGDSLLPLLLVDDLLPIRTNTEPSGERGAEVSQISTLLPKVISVLSGDAGRMPLARLSCNSLRDS